MSTSLALAPDLLDLLAAACVASAKACWLSGQYMTRPGDTSSCQPCPAGSACADGVSRTECGAGTASSAGAPSGTRRMCAATLAAAPRAVSAAR